MNHRRVYFPALYFSHTAAGGDAVVGSAALRRVIGGSGLVSWRLHLHLPHVVVIEVLQVFGSVLQTDQPLPPQPETHRKDGYITSCQRITWHHVVKLHPHLAVTHTARAQQWFCRPTKVTQVFVTFYKPPASAFGFRSYGSGLKATVSGWASSYSLTVF